MGPAALLVAAMLQWTPPPGWDASDYSNAGGADAVVAYERGADRITLRAYGAPGSDYKSLAKFLAGPAATTMGRAPKKAGSVRVGGRASPLYRREYPLADGDPHAPSSRAPRMARETFCVLPPLPDGRFAVLAYARESPIPDLKGDGEKAWKTFLAGVKPAKAAKAER